MAKEDEYLKEFDELIEKYANRDVQRRIKNLKKGKEAYKKYLGLGRGDFNVDDFEIEDNLPYTYKMRAMGAAADILDEASFSGNLSLVDKALRIYQKLGKAPRKKEILEAVEEHFKKYGPNQRNERVLNKIREYLATPSKSQKGLEKKLIGVISGVSLIAALFFLSSNITGNVVGNLAQNNSNWIGGILFILGIVGLAVSFRR